MGGVGEGRKRAVTGSMGWGWGPGWGNCGAQTPPCQADQAAEDLECLKWGGGEGYPKTERDTWLAGGGGGVRVSQWCPDTGMRAGKG